MMYLIIMACRTVLRDFCKIKKKTRKHWHAYRSTLLRDFNNIEYIISNESGFMVIEEDLGEVYGYFNSFRRRKFIHINERLAEPKKVITCSHELGHAFLHPEEMTPALTRKNLVSELKVEKEANYFATKLIVDGSHLDENIETSYDVLDYYGLPYSFERFL